MASVSEAVLLPLRSCARNHPRGLLHRPRRDDRRQERWYLDHLRSVDDDFVPYLMPWFGTVVAASAFGCRVSFPPGQDPAVDPPYYPVQTPGGHPATARARSGARRPHAQGPRVPAVHAGEQRPARRHHRLPGSAHHGQPAHGLRQAHLPHVRRPRGDAPSDGYHHRRAHHLGPGAEGADRRASAATASATRASTSVRTSASGSPTTTPCSIDADLYREFVVPYNSRILTAFGGGIIHYCGNATHHVDSFLATDGLKGINTFSLYDFDALGRTARARQGPSGARSSATTHRSTTAPTSTGSPPSSSHGASSSSRSTRPSWACYRVAATSRSRAPKRQPA